METHDVIVQRPIVMTRYQDYNFDTMSVPNIAISIRYRYFVIVQDTQAHDQCPDISKAVCFIYIIKIVN